MPTRAIQPQPSKIDQFRALNLGTFSEWSPAKSPSAWSIWLTLSLLLGLRGVGATGPGALPHPNIVIFLADDLGYSDLGCYGSEIATPNLDTLAQSGVRFTQFYNTGRCWPSRASILTGYYAQQVRRDTVPGVPSGMQGHRPDWAPLLPALLHSLGFRSYHSGKWHLDGKPTENGFDHSYSLNDHDRHFGPQLHTEDDIALPPVSTNDTYYSSTAIADHAIKHLRDHASQYPDRPFFSFIAFTAPHFPLQAPATDIKRYSSRYLSGWDRMREERWQRMKTLGIGVPSLSSVERDVGPPYSFPEAMAALGPSELNRPLEWSGLNDSQREFQAGKMAIHAAMVDRMDREIGRVIDQVKAMHALDNTLILFLSDNGASAEIMVRGDGHDPEAVCGTGATFLSLGPGWSSLANTPFRRHKTWVHEGGISTPLIVSWPAGIRAHGELRDSPSHVIDLVPTILDVVGGKPGFATGGPTPPGMSLRPAFSRNGESLHPWLWWQHEGNRAYRLNDWKIVASGTNSPWELYNLSKDRAESINLADRHPGKLRELAQLWEKTTAEFAATARQKATPPATGKRPE